MPMEARDFKIGTAYATQDLHFVGGLRGYHSDRGWVLYPVSSDRDSDALVFSSPDVHRRYAEQECKARFVGMAVQYKNAKDGPPVEVWEPGSRDPLNGLNASDTWDAVAYNADLAGDGQYASCARSLAASLTAAGLRLRDVSNKYHQQLVWALGEGKQSGRWFSNGYLLDLYADFHSLVSELSSARDYLSKIAAAHAGAPTNIDSLARLEGWLKKPVNGAGRSVPLVHLLLSAAGAEEVPGWLRRLGAIRNELLHNQPMAANRRVSGLVLESLHTTYGPVQTIRLAEPLHETPLDAQGPDPFAELAESSHHLENLCRAGWKLAKYPADLPIVAVQGWD